MVCQQIQSQGRDRLFSQKLLEDGNIQTSTDQFQLQWLLIRFFELLIGNKVGRDQIYNTQFVFQKTSKKSEKYKGKFEEFLVLNDLSQEHFHIIENLNQNFCQAFKKDIQIEHISKMMKGDLIQSIDCLQIDCGEAKDYKICYDSEKYTLVNILDA